MWPFEKRLKDQDAVERYRDWLKKWFLNSNAYRCAVGALAIVLVLGVIGFAYTMREQPEPAFKHNNNPVVTFDQSKTVDNINAVNDFSDCGSARPHFSASEEQLINGIRMEKYGTAQIQNEVITKNVDYSQVVPTLVQPVSGDLIADYGFKFSGVYGDYRFNDGLDFLVEQQEKIAAPASGKIVNISDNRGEKTVTIDHGNGWLTQCRGDFTPLLTPGRSVIQGDAIGACKKDTLVHMVLMQGDSPVDPLPYITLR